MRPFLIVLFFLIFNSSFAQKKQCDFSMDSRTENLSQLIDSLQGTYLKTLNKKRFIPKFIKRTLNCWTQKFDIANPGKRYQSGDVYMWHAPIRQLTYLGLSDKYVIISYRKGGKGSIDHILIFRFDNKKIKDFWAGCCARIRSQEELLYFLKNYKDLLQSSAFNL